MGWEGSLSSSFHSGELSLSTGASIGKDSANPYVGFAEASHWPFLVTQQTQCLTGALMANGLFRSLPGADPTDRCWSSLAERTGEDLVAEGPPHGVGSEAVIYLDCPKNCLSSLWP